MNQSENVCIQRTVEHLQVLHYTDKRQDIHKQYEAEIDIKEQCKNKVTFLVCKKKEK